MFLIFVFNLSKLHCRGNSADSSCETRFLLADQTNKKCASLSSPPLISVFYEVLVFIKEYEMFQKHFLFVWPTKF